MRLSTFVLIQFQRKAATDHGTAYLTVGLIAQAIRNATDLDQWDSSYNGSLALANDQIRRLMESGRVVKMKSQRYRLATPDEAPEEAHDAFRDPVPECRDRCGSEFPPGTTPGV